MDIATIREELADEDGWANEEVRDFYCDWWMRTEYCIAEVKRRNPAPQFRHYAPILNDLSDEEIMAFWARYQIEKGET